jgi:protein O-GlcNAc transferase
MNSSITNFHLNNSVISDDEILEFVQSAINGAIDNPFDTEALTQIKNSRLVCFKAIINFYVEKLNFKLSNKIELAVEILIQNGSYQLPMTKLESEYVNNEIKKIIHDNDNLNTYLSLITSFLYIRPHKIKNEINLNSIPEELQKIGRRYLFTPPEFFSNLGEAEEYAEHLNKIMGEIAGNISRSPHDPSWNSIALDFVNMATTIPLYFSNSNLKKSMALRAQIIEHLISHHKGPGGLSYDFPPKSSKRIKLGVLAAHYRPQTETYATLPVYCNLDSDKFEIILISQLPFGTDPLEKYCLSFAQNSLQLCGKLAEDVLAIRELELDAIWIGTNLTAVINYIVQLSVHRLAPLQITGGCSPCTTGFKNLDYFVSGKSTESAKASADYTENLHLVNGPAHCFDMTHSLQANEKDFSLTTRSSLGISSEEVVFVSGANFFKIIPELLNTWIKILKQTGSSKIVLFPFNPNWTSRYPVANFLIQIEDQCILNGITKDRFVIVPPLPNRLAVLNLISIADIYLDSFPYSGMTSLLDPVAVGLPIVAIEGDFQRQRMSASALHALGLSNWLVASEQAYIEKSIAIANDLKLRQDMKIDLEKSMKVGPKFLNSLWYSKEIENFLLKQSRKLSITSSSNLKNVKQRIPNQIDKALVLQNAGEIDSAKNIFDMVLKTEPRNAVALYSMAAIESSKLNFDNAFRFIQLVTISHPNFAQAHLAKSIILFNLGKFEESYKAALKAIHLEPSLPTAKEHLETVKVAQALQANPIGELANAGILIDPKLHELTQQAIAFQGQAKHKEALEVLQQALMIKNNDFATLYSMGISLGATGKKMDALDCFIRAAEAAPQLALAHFAKAQSYADIGLSDDALICFDKAIEVDPSYAQAYTNKSALLQSIDRHHDALLTLIACVEVDPDNFTAFEGQGHLLGQFKQYGLSVNAFKRALQIDPTFNYGEGHLMHARLSCCDWTEFEESRERIFEGIRTGQKVCGAMTIMSLTDDAALARQCIEIYAKDKYGDPLFKLWNGEKYVHRRQRVAFISGDFRIHPVGYLLIEMIENFDKEKYELTGVFTGKPDGSDLWKRYRCAFDHYLDAKNIPSLELAKLLRAMEIDIAIDLSGHTEGTKLDVLSHRPAPVQITYLGFPGTLGLPFIDYLIADARIIPPELQRHYREKILYLPHCYLPRDTSVVPSPITPKRSDFGLPDEGFIFCSFNHDYKINPPMFKIWMSLLMEVPGSVLWLMKLNEAAQDNLSKEALNHGIDPNRIVYATRVPLVEDHLARYRLADLFLDTFPYNGHTTAGDALRAGIPVVSLCGNSFASRVAASLLHDVGLPQYACSTLENYYNTALRMSQHPEELTTFRNHIQVQLSSGKWPQSAATQAHSFASALGQISK